MRGRGASVAPADQVDQQAQREQRRQHAEDDRHPARHALVSAASDVARIAAPAVSASASRRPARRIVVSSDAARKFTSSFWPGRAPISRSTASITRSASGP